MINLTFLKTLAYHQLIPRVGNTLLVKCMNGREERITVNTIQKDELGININDGELIMGSQGGGSLRRNRLSIESKSVKTDIIMWIHKEKTEPE